MKGEVDSKKAYDALNIVLKRQFPNLEYQIMLLPQAGTELVSALINNSVANMRSKPKHSAELSTQALLGTPVRVLKKKGEWYLVQTPNRYIAWVDDDGIVEIGKKELEAIRQLPKVVYSI